MIIQQTKYSLCKEQAKITNIWRAVIKQALEDVIQEASTKRYISSDLIDWLFNQESDFEMVCVLAEFDPDYIKKIFKQTIVEHQCKLKQNDRTKVFNKLQHKWRPLRVKGRIKQ